MTRGAKGGQVLSPAASLASFRRAPVGHFVRGDSFFYWCASPTLFGFSLWGRPGGSDLEQLTRALLVELGPDVGSHRSLVDASLVEEVDPAAFEVLQRYVKTHRKALGERVTRLSLVRPAGLAGAVVAGFYEVLDAPYPTQTFTDLAPALAWLGETPLFGELLLERRAELSGVAPLLGQLRSVLGALGTGHSVAEIARVMSLSPRTLQRRLGELDTSYQKELLRHRLRGAELALLESDQPISAIALEAGFATPQHFSSAFRKLTGRTPSEFRQSRR